MLQVFRRLQLARYFPALRDGYMFPALADGWTFSRAFWWWFPSLRAPSGYIV